MTCMLPRHVPICYNEGRVGGRWSVGLYGPMCRATNPVDGWREVIFSCLEVGEFYSLLPQLPPMEVVSWMKNMVPMGPWKIRKRFQQGHFLNHFHDYGRKSKEHQLQDGINFRMLPR